MALEMAGRVELLGRDKERELFGVLRDESESTLSRRQARDTLILANLRLVVWVCRQPWVRGVSEATGLPVEEFIAEGNIGLVRAVDGFDLENGAKFATYATRSITHEVQHFVHRKMNIVRIPDHLYADANRVRNGEEIVNSRNLPPSNPELLAAAVNVMSFGRVDCGEVELVAKSDDEDQDSRPYIDSIDPAKILARLMARFDRRTKDIIVRRFGLGGQSPMTQEGVAKRHGLGKTRVCQIEHEALKFMRGRAEELGLRA